MAEVYAAGVLRHPPPGLATLRVMPEDVPEVVVDPYRRQWWWRLRRAFGIPDLVRDDAARKVIAYEVAQQTEPGNFDRLSIASELVTAFLTLGESGELDELFFGEPHQVLFENPNRLSVDERIKRMASDDRAPQPGGAIDWSNMIEFIKTTVADHVRRWPYEANVVNYLPPD
jgi:hypothetical protein